MGMGRVLVFDRSRCRTTVRELEQDPAVLLRELIDALQVLSATRPDALAAIKAYARHLADDELARMEWV